MRKISGSLAQMLQEVQSDSPVLTSGLLSDHSYSEMNNDLFKEEGKALEVDLNQLHAGMQSDAKDFKVLMDSMSKTLALEELFKKSINDSVNPTTVSMLLSEFSNIYKDTLGQEFIYAKNLNNENAYNTLEAGLQSVSSFIDTLKKLLKTVWEAIVKAGKFFWSKIRQFMTWIFGNMRGVAKKQAKNTFSLLTLEAARNVYKEYKNSLDTLDADKITVDIDLVAKIQKTFEKELDGLISKMDLKSFTTLDIKSELKFFMEDNSTLFTSAELINLVMNVALVSKRVHDNFLSAVETNREIKNSIVILYLINASANNKFTENVRDYLDKIDVENIAELDVKGSFSQSFRNALSNPTKEIFSGLKEIEAKNILYSIIYGDVGKYLTVDTPKICNKISDLYIDILTIFKQGKPAYELDKFVISRIPMLSDKYILSGIKPVDAKIYEIEYMNFYSRGTTDTNIAFDLRDALSRDHTGGFMPIDILLTNSKDNKYKHNESLDKTSYFMALDKMGKDYDAAIAETEKYVEYFSKADQNELSSKRDLINSLGSIVNNLNAINPTTGIQLFQTVNKAYSTIVNELDVNKMIVDAFNDLNK